MCTVTVPRWTEPVETSLTLILHSNVRPARSTTPLGHLTDRTVTDPFPCATARRISCSALVLSIVAVPHPASAPASASRSAGTARFLARTAVTTLELPDPLDRLGQPIVRRRQRDPEEPGPARPVRLPGGNHHSSRLEHVLTVRRGGLETLRYRAPDVDRPLRPAHRNPGPGQR